MQLIKSLDVPSLLIVGGVGSVVSLEMAAEMEAGHGIPCDQPERFSTVVQTFLRSVST